MSKKERQRFARIADYIARRRQMKKYSTVTYNSPDLEQQMAMWKKEGINSSIPKGFLDFMLRVRASKQYTIGEARGKFNRFMPQKKVEITEKDLDYIFYGVGFAAKNPSWNWWIITVQSRLRNILKERGFLFPKDSDEQK